jgi:hypothetical protein
MEVAKMEIDDENVITSGLSIKMIMNILKDFGVELEHFWQAITASEAKCWIAMDSEGFPHMLVTDGDSGAVLVKTVRQFYTSLEDAVDRAETDPMMTVLPVLGDWCGIPFDFISKFEEIIYNEKPQSERWELQGDKVTH